MITKKVHVVLCNYCHKTKGIRHFLNGNPVCEECLNCNPHLLTALRNSMFLRQWEQEDREAAARHETYVIAHQRMTIPPLDEKELGWEASRSKAKNIAEALPAPILQRRLQGYEEKMQRDKEAVAVERKRVPPPPVPAPLPAAPAPVPVRPEPPEDPERGLRFRLLEFD